MQHNCNVHNTVRYLVKVGQRPNKHKTRGENTLIKNLYSYFLEGRLLIDEEDTMLIKVPNGHFSGFAISIPPALAPGLIQCLHIRMQHPSWGQLLSLMSRYFHCIGLKKMIDLTSDNCHQCLALRPLPKEVLAQSTTIPEALGSRFSADVIERHSQRILVIKEGLSSFAQLSLIPDQTAETLKEATITSILPFIPSSGAIIRTDGATAWQSLTAEAKDGKGIWGKYNIRVEVGNLLSINKNPEAAVKETQKEILKLSPDIKTISKLELAQVQKQLNLRVRFKGFAAQEILTGREQITNKKLDISDADISAKIWDNRASNHDKITPSPAPNNYKVGDLVYIKADLNKNHARDVHIVTGFEGGAIQVKKLQSQFRKTLYTVQASRHWPQAQRCHSWP